MHAHTVDAVTHRVLHQFGVAAALAKAEPGTPRFRTALRDALAGVRELPPTRSVYTVRDDARHEGFDERGRVLLTVEDGRWRLRGF